MVAGSNEDGTLRGVISGEQWGAVGSSGEQWGGTTSEDRISPAPHRNMTRSKQTQVNSSEEEEEEDGKVVGESFSAAFWGECVVCCGWLAVIGIHRLTNCSLGLFVP